MDTSIGLSNRKVQTVILALVSLYFAYLVAYLSPDCQLRSRFVNPLLPYFLYWDLDQRWCLFAPTFRKWNYHSVATMTFEDGTKMMLKHPWIRLFTVYGLDNGYKELWPDRARHCGRKYCDRTNRPTSLSLNYFWSEIAPPPIQPVGAYPPRSHYSSALFYRYAPEDFQ